MTPSRFVRQSVFMLCLSMIVAGLFAQMAVSADFQPQEGQAGKDVIWLPTCQELVDKMLDMAKVTPQDYVVDLGSGDGRTVITAVKRGARGLGIEYNPDMVEFSKKNAAKEGVSDKAQFIKADIFESDFSQATVITMFLMPHLNLMLRPKILDFKPGTRVVSNSFTMEDWIPDQTETVNNEQCSSYNTALLWIVPAKVEGLWKLPQGELTLKQTFQMVSGTFKSGSRAVPITNGKLDGDVINFNADGVKYTGRVNGATMEGTFEAGGNNGKWNATQVGKIL